jgi:hypothetical protein
MSYGTGSLPWARSAAGRSSTESGGGIEVRPYQSAAKINPAAVQALAGAGSDIAAEARHRCRQRLRVVITMGRGVACPSIPASRISTGMSRAWRRTRG